MALSYDLLAQARLLTTLDPGIPNQANLRRAVSSAYYAVFHLLIAEAVARLIPQQPRGLRDRVSRAFHHGEMNQVCSAFLRPQIPSALMPLLPRGVPSSIRFIAETFSLLQEERHKADYDVGLVLSRAYAIARVENAEAAFRAWDLIRDTDEAAVFLAALAFGARWSK